MPRKSFSFLILSFLLSAIPVRAQTTYEIDPEAISHQVDINVYGHFLEHIYNSANNGLWGDLVWNRSFEMVNTTQGEWTVENNELVQTSLNTNIRLPFGEVNWTDYELSIEARKLGGTEGFLILFRADGGDFYWLNLGGWGNDQHGIEKATNENKTTLWAMPGDIATGQWYHIRIRCVGNEFQVFLDDELLVTLEDNNAHMTGQVGVGTWATSATFRNISVKALPSGDLLFDDLPDLGEPAPLSLPNWERVNADLFSSSDELNSQRALMLVNGSDSLGGVQQHEFNIKKQSYSGSFWAKAAIGKPISLNLLAGENLLDQAQFTAYTGDWEEFVFDLNPTRATTNGTLQIVFPGPDTVLIDQVSMMGADAANNDGFRPDLLEAVNGLQPPIIRWPGGCYVSAYFWKDGIGKQEARGTFPINLWDDMDVNSLGTDEFLQLCERTGAEPLIVVNSGILDVTCGVPITTKLNPEQYLQDALDWMEYCNGDVSTEWGAVRAANGHPEPYNVKYWEIDNEVWVAGIDDYIDVVKEFAPAMREKYPDIELIACGSGSYDYNWNQRLIDECADLIDYVSTHHYEEISNFDQGVVEYENFIEDFADQVAASSNPDLKMYMSEWGVWEPIDWRSGLHTGGLLNAFERQGEVFTLAGPALFLRHQDACCWNNAFINFDNESWFPAPNYVVMKLWREHYAPNFLEMEASNPNLNAVATLSEDSTQMFFKVVNPNPGAEEVIIDVDTAFGIAGAKIRQVHSSNLTLSNSLQRPENIKEEAGTLAVLENGVSFESPGYSAIVVTLNLKKNEATSEEEEEVLGFDEGSGLLIHYPNPFTDQISIHFTVHSRNTSSLKIFDTAGRQINVLTQGEFLPGEYHVTWPANDASGNRVKDGIYLIEFKSGGREQVERVVLKNK